MEIPDKTPRPIENLNLGEGDWVTVVSLQPTAHSWVFDKDQYKRTFKITAVSNGFYATCKTGQHGLKNCIGYIATQDDIDKAYWQDCMHIIRKKYIRGPVYRKQISVETAVKYGLEELINKLKNHG